MFKQELAEIFERDLLKLKEEIQLYQNKSDLWVVKNGISNSAGNLCLHLIGNLNHFIGAVLGNSGYVRDRDSEFSSRNVSDKDLLAGIDHVLVIVKHTLQGLTDEQMKGNFPIEKHGKVVTMEHMLLHLLTHFNYHLGQINYHRRLC